jgi:thiamine kinase-like enzyme
MPKKKNTISLENLFDKEYIKKIFKKNILNPYILKTDFNIYKIKNYIGPDFEHVVASYVFKSENKQVDIYCSAHSDGTRKETFKILKLVYQANITKQKPLFYDKKTQAMFYEGLSGHNLFRYIKRKKELDKLIINSAQKIAKLHQIKLSRKIPTFRINKKNIDPSNALKNRTAYRKEEIISLHKDIKKTSRLVNIYKDKNYTTHGDFHPENIIIGDKDNKASIIDFTDLMCADYTKDLGSFIQQFGFMSGSRYSDDKKDYYRQLFLDAYFKERKIKQTSQITDRIIFFQAWLALRSAIYYSTLPNMRNEADALIKECTSLLNKINH